MPENPTTRVPQRLQAFLAALAELDEAERLRLLRAHLEYALDVVQANEEEYFTFLSECATLAADNMQDIRIEQLELRFAALDNPPAKQWGEVMTEVALGFALQVGILLAWEGVATGVIALAGWRAMTLATKAARLELRAARAQENAIRAEVVYLEREKYNLSIVQRGGVWLMPTRGGWQVMNSSYIQPDNFQTFTIPSDLFSPVPGSLARVLNQDVVRDSYDRIALRNSIVQMATVGNRARVSKALAAHEAALNDGIDATAAIKKGWGAWWRDNVGNEKGGVLLNTTEEVLNGIDSVVAAGGGPSSTGAGPGSADEPFLTSEITGRYLDWAREERLAVVETYANLRLLLRATSDEDLLEGDAVIMHMALLGTEVLGRWQELRLRPNAARVAVVKGMEAAFWREYLLANGMLGIDPMHQLTVQDDLVPGQIFGGHLVLGEQQYAEPQYWSSEPIPLGYKRYLTDYCRGASRMPEQLAGVLFQRFAQPHFADENRAKNLLPFVYEAARYVNVAIPPRDTFWGYPDPDALRRIDEMRYMVIQYFDAMGRDGVDPAVLAPFSGLSFMSSVAGQHAAESRAAWLAGQVSGVANDDDLSNGEAASTLAAETLFTRLRDATEAAAGSPVALQIAQLRFNDMLTDLNQDIQAYQLLKSGALELGSVEDKRNPEALADEIDREQELLGEAYGDLLGQFGDDAEARGAFIAQYQDAKEAVMKWTTSSNWVWYGGGPTNETPPP